MIAHKCPTNIEEDLNLVQNKTKKKKKTASNAELFSVVYMKLCMFNFHDSCDVLQNYLPLNLAIFLFHALTQKTSELPPLTFIQDLVLLMTQGGASFFCQLQHYLSLNLPRPGGSMVSMSDS